MMFTSSETAIKLINWTQWRSSRMSKHGPNNSSRAATCDMRPSSPGPNLPSENRKFSLVSTMQFFYKREKGRQRNVKENTAIKMNQNDFVKMTGFRGNFSSLHSIRSPRKVIIFPIVTNFDSANQALSSNLWLSIRTLHVVHSVDGVDYCSLLDSWFFFRSASHPQYHPAVRETVA